MKIVFSTLMLFGLMALVRTPTDVFQPDASSSLAVAGGETRVVSTADFDGDGDIDVFFGNFGQDNQLYVNRGNGRFDALDPEAVVVDGGFTFGAAFGDMDGDGDADLAVANGSSSNNALYQNLGAPNAHHSSWFAKLTASPVSSDGGESYDVAWVDVDGDTDYDLVFANTLQPAFLYTNDGSGGFSAVVSGALVTDNGPSRDLAYGDLDGDGDQDLLFANSNDEVNFVFINQGGSQGGTEGDFARLPSSDPLASEVAKSFGIETGDFDGDGDLDVFVSNRKDQLNTLYRNDGSGSFTLASDQHPSQDGGDSYRAAFGDAEGDGDLDLFVANKDDNNFLYLNDGTDLARVTTGDAVTSGGNSRDARFGDLNADGALELMVANTGGEANFFYTNSTSPWADLGAAYQPHSAPEPHLSGAGPLGGHTAAGLFIEDGPAAALIVIFAGASRIDLGFRGGVLVPAPDLTLSGFTTDASGDWEQQFILPGAVPSGLSIYLQAWMVDVSSPTGVVATNALEATFQ